MTTKNQFVDDFGELSVELLQNIAEILTLRLPEGPDRVIAAKWVKKFKNCDKNDFKQYLALFVSSLTKQMLVEPFNVAPIDPSSAQWQTFDKEHTLQDINSAVIRDIYKESLTPPYKIEVSSNLKEYVCFQEVPFFGAHFYYAFSPHEQIDKWTKFNKLNVPRNQVEIMRRDEKISPIATRGTPKVAVRTQRGLGTPRGRTPRTRGAARPVWEGPVPDEPEPEAPAPKPMISISLNANAKSIPAALQRRMSAAAEKAKQLQEKKAQDRSKTLSKTPSSSRVAGRSGSARGAKTKARPRGVDDIDAALISGASTSRQKTPPPPPPKSPEYTGPFAEQRRALDRLRKSNLPELLNTTREMREISGNIIEERERLNQGGSADINNASRIERREVNIGKKITKMIQAQQISQVQTAAEEAVETIETTQMDLTALNEYLDKTKPVISNGLIERLETVKRSMQESSRATNNLSIRTEIATGGQILNQLDVIADVHSGMAGALAEIKPTSRKDEILIEGLEQISLETVDEARRAAHELTSSMQQGDANVTNVLYKTAHDVQNLMDNSFSGDEMYVTALEHFKDEKTRKAAEIYTQHYEQKLERDIQRHMDFARSTPIVNKFLKRDARGKLLDYEGESLFDQADLNISPVEEDDEDLLNISMHLMDDFFEAIDAIEDEILPVLENARSDEENEYLFDEAVGGVEESLEKIDNCLAAVVDVKLALEGEKTQNY